MIGETISHYRILETLGKGGMGVVYLAEDLHLGRRVAIKFLTADADQNYRARFLREARTVSSLTHPNIVMELVRGKTLGKLLHEDGLTLRQAVEIAASIVEALTEAHGNGIVHRDIKPSNVVVTEKGQVKVLDFGLVKQLLDTSHSSFDLEAPTLYGTRTESHAIVGTPLYLSPEQAAGKPVDGRSDLFALGALLYECIAGQSAFSGRAPPRWIGTAEGQTRSGMAPITARRNRWDRLSPSTTNSHWPTRAWPKRWPNWITATRPKTSYCGSRRWCRTVLSCRLLTASTWKRLIRLWPETFQMQSRLIRRLRAGRPVSRKCMSILVALSKRTMNLTRRSRTISRPPLSIANMRPLIFGRASSTAANEM